ncbi:WYL domain-containing protein [Pseudodesulfovibrio methanolicus]|uniref:WYL domain-containing protein n=1 Tax=Pseudodesulfovibrio methanolicus TaxID=3126690 RepID=A0ABZ2IVP4_9BACT
MGWIAFAVLLIIVIYLFGRKKENSPAGVPVEPREAGLEDEYDPFDGWRRSLTTPWRGQASIEFSYDSNSSGWSHRKVELDEIAEGPEGRVYLHGFCSLRNENRFFRLDRIVGPIACDGAELSGEELFQALAGTALQATPGPCPCSGGARR